MTRYNGLMNFLVKATIIYSYINEKGTGQVDSYSGGGKIEKSKNQFLEINL